MPKSSVLIIDDDDAQRLALTGLLKKRGYDCFPTAHGEDVEKILTEHAKTIKACALDMTLKPECRSGLQTLRAIRHLNPTLPVLVFTGQEPSVAEDAFVAGATLFMRKPYDTQDLIAAIDSLVLMHSLRQNLFATEGELEMLQAALDAMKVEVTISKPDGETMVKNTPRTPPADHGNSNIVTGKKTNGTWIEEPEGDRWIWKHEATAITKSGRTFQVKTALDVTRWKLVEQFRQVLFKDATSKSREKLVEFVAEWLHVMYGCGRVRIWLGTKETMTGVTSRGMQPGFDMRGQPFPKFDPKASRALEDRRPFLLTESDLQDDPCFKTLDKEGVQTQIQIPLVWAGGLIGLISVDDKGSMKHLDIEDVEAMSVLGPAVADAIQANDEKKWLQTLNVIDEPLTAGSSLEDVFQTMGSELAKMIHADAGVVFIRENATKPLKVRCVIGSDDRELWTVTHPGTKGFINQCLKTNELVFVPNIWEVSEFRDCFEKLECETWKRFLNEAMSVLVEPIRCGSLVIGVLFLRCRERVALDEVDKLYLTAIAKRVSIALAKLDQSQRMEAALIQQVKLHDLAMLTAGVAHGMRNPLATIQSSLDCVRRECASSKEPLDPARVLGSLREIEVATQHSLETLGKLIDWAKPHGAESQWMSLGSLIEDLVALIRDELEFKGIELDVEIDPTLPSVIGSPDQLRMAISDLFWNAAKAMPQGGRLQVRLRTTSDQQHIELTVADTGVGMSEEELETLFSVNPFEPLPAGGTGLGLYLLRKVLAGFKAELNPQSIVGQGTTMTVVFPIPE